MTIYLLHDVGQYSAIHLLSRLGEIYLSGTSCYRGWNLAAKTLRLLAVSIFTLLVGKLEVECFIVHLLFCTSLPSYSTAYSVTFQVDS